MGQQIRNYGLIDSIDELATFCTKLSQDAKPFGFDIETGYHGPDREKFALHPETAIIAGISFSNDPSWARYAPLGHDAGPNLDNHAAAELFWTLLNTGLGVAHNAGFEARHLSRWFRTLLAEHPLYGADVRRTRGYFPIRSDTQVEAYLKCEYDDNGKTVVGLKPLVHRMFNHTMTELYDLFEDLPQNRRKMLRFNVLPLTPKVVNYACEDSAWCLAVHDWYHPQVEDTLLYAVEHAIATEVVPDMEDFGVRYDWELARWASQELQAFRDKYNAEIMEDLTDMVGRPVAVNLASPQQIGKVLYEQLGLETTVYTDTTRDLPRDQRKMSTGKIALAGLAKKYPVVKKMTNWKEINRLLGTYLGDEHSKRNTGGYEAKYGYAEDGMCHPNHLSAWVITGRFAVSDPPYQQSPKVYHYDLKVAAARHEEHTAAHGKTCKCDDPAFEPPPGTCFKFNFRDIITAPPEHYILGFDLSQAELRAIAGEACERSMLEAFANGVDIHIATAALMLGKKIEDVTKDDRDIGKTLNFALGYGMSVKGLADRLGISVEEAQALFDKYFSALPSVSSWRIKQVETGKRQGYLVSKFGRRLPIWEYKSDKRYIYNKGDRACVNYPIQGAATGDFVKIAMVRAHRALKKAGLADSVHLVMNVHDALEFYVHRSVPPKQVIDVLQPAVIFPVEGWPTLVADWHLAKRWGSPQEIKIIDGSLTVGGTKLYEETVTVEEDDETGEEIVMLPEVDVDVIRSALSTVDLHDTHLTEPDGGRQVIVTLTQMPEVAAWQRFKTFLAGRPGRNTLTLSTPEGDLDLNLPTGNDLTVSDEGALSVMLGPVTISYDITGVDSLDLSDSMVF